MDAHARGCCAGDGAGCSDDDEDFDARYEAAIEAAANTLRDDGNLKIKS